MIRVRNEGGDLGRFLISPCVSQVGLKAVFLERGGASNSSFLPDSATIEANAADYTCQLQERRGGARGRRSRRKGREEIVGDNSIALSLSLYSRYSTCHTRRTVHLSTHGLCPRRCTHASSRDTLTATRVARGTTRPKIVMLRSCFVCPPLIILRGRSIILR